MLVGRYAVAENKLDDEIERLSSEMEITIRDVTENGGVRRFASDETFNGASVFVEYSEKGELDLHVPVPSAAYVKYITWKNFREAGLVS